MENDPRDDRHPDRESDTDASDVVQGPVGDAHLVDPTEARPLSADLDALPAIDDTEPPEGAPPGDDASPG